MYEIDYTQDFFGVVDRKTLVAHLLANGFEMQGSGSRSDKGTILDNTSSVGDHVCPWLHEARGHTARTKIYNKVVSARCKHDRLRYLCCLEWCPCLSDFQTPAFRNRLPADGLPGFFCLPLRRSPGYSRFRTCRLRSIPGVWPALVGAPANGRYLPPTRLFSLQNTSTPPSLGRAFSTAFLPAAWCLSLFSQSFPRFWSLWHLQAPCSRFLCFFEDRLGLLAPPSKFWPLSASTLSRKILCRECRRSPFDPNTRTRRCRLQTAADHPMAGGLFGLGGLPSSLLWRYRERGCFPSSFLGENALPNSLPPEGPCSIG